jgi:hypothetical protein
MNIIPENATTAELQQEQSDKNAMLSSASWLKEVEAAEKNLQKFTEQGHRIVKRFLDKRDSGDEGKKKYNLFQVNVGILISTLYAKFPKPMVTREWEDQNDDVARVAGIILERSLKIKQDDDFDAAMKSVIQDRLVPGVAQVWFRYDPTIVQEPVPPPIDPMTGQPQVDPATGQPAQPQMMDKLVSERVITDYVNWEDFIWSPSRTWDEVRWVGRKCKMTRKDCIKRFGDQITNQLSFQQGTAGDKSSVSSELEMVVEYATVYEIWCKQSRAVYWVTKGFSFLLDKKPDPFDGAIEGFFPCPKPLLALTSTSSTVPRADYLMIQDQYEELDEVNNRINKLQKAIKAVGVYDKTNKEIGRIFNEGIDNTMIAAENFSQFAASGGFKGMMDWVPIEAMVNALQRLREVRGDLVQQIYELSGISDIMRGATKASETLGAQQLKAQYGGVRLQFMQMEVAKFVEQALTIKASIMVKLFQPQTFLISSNIQETPDAQLADPAIQLLKSPTWAFKVTVHADSMAVPEFNAERDARIGLVRSIAEYMTGIAPVVQQSPQSAPFFLQILQWVVASFRSGREIEGVLDQWVAQATQQSQTPPPPPQPNPKDVSQAKLNDAKTLLVTGEAVAQNLENHFAAANPQEVFGQPPKPVSTPPSTD